MLPDIFFLVPLCDRNVPAVGLQFVLKNPPESTVLHTESVVQHRGDVVLSVEVRTEYRCQTFAATQQRRRHQMEQSGREREREQAFTDCQTQRGAPQVDTELQGGREGTGRDRDGAGAAAPVPRVSPTLFSLPRVGGGGGQHLYAPMTSQGTWLL